MLENTQRKEKEKRLAEALQEGDQKSLAQLYDAYAPVLLGLVSKIVKDSEKAEGILQKTFLMIWEQRKSYDASKMGLLTWMIMMAKTTAIEAIKVGNMQEIPLDYKSVAIPEQDSNMSLEGSFCQLSPQQRAVLDLMYLKGFSCQQAATELNISVEI